MAGSGWRLPAVVVVALLVGLVGFARLSVKPVLTAPAVTVNPSTPSVAPSPLAVSTARPAIASEPAPSPAPTDEPVALANLGPNVQFIYPTGFTSAASPWLGRYADGIPSVYQGEPVYRVNDALNIAIYSDSGDSGAMLIGGWYTRHALGTPACDPPPATCGTGQIADSPLQLNSEGVGVTGASTAVDGPVVIRGVARTRCAPPQNGRLSYMCLYAISAADVVWHGDELTNAAPIAPLPLLEGLRQAVPAFDPQPYHDQPTCLLHRPSQAYRSDTGKLQFVFVFPSTVERVDGATELLIGPPYGDIGSGCDTRPPLDGKSGWISVENVIVRVDNVNGAVADSVRAVLDRLGGNTSGSGG